MSRPATGRDSLTSDVLTVGAGPAGLAVTACVQRLGLRATILESTDCIAPSWRHFYDRLHLHTYKGSSALPFMKMPGTYPRYPSREQMTEYFGKYAEHFGIKPHFQQKVVAVDHDGQLWHARTEEKVYTARSLVLATGYARVPKRPVFMGQDTFTGTILHSSEYSSGKAYRGQRVLVVGFGNSGGEIALDLLENGAYPSLSVRSAVNVIPRELLGIPIDALAVPLGYLPTGLADALTNAVTFLKFGDLSKHGLGKPSYGPLRQIRQDSRIPVIDVGTVARIKQGQISVYPKVGHFYREGVSFDDSGVQPFDAVIMATGFKSTLPFPLPSHPTAELQDPRVVFREAPNLYGCGYQVAATGVLKEIGREAKQIASDISAKASSSGSR